MAYTAPSETQLVDAQRGQLIFKYQSGSDGDAIQPMAKTAYEAGDLVRARVHVAGIRLQTQPLRKTRHRKTAHFELGGVPNELQRLGGCFVDHK